tara:strand:- start:965 stop:1225 length:261 start_codon:yes stop_codon:yes gene_type:complete
MTNKELAEKLRYAMLHAPEIADQNAAFYVNSEYYPIRGLIIGDEAHEGADVIEPGGVVLLTVEGDGESNIRYKIKEIYGLPKTTQD